jgi:methionyl-tRNA formyltransferase
MRLVFAGTPLFAEQALRALVGAGHQVLLVLTQPDRTSGRGLKFRHSEVKTAALQLALPIAQPPTLKSDESLEILRGAQAQAMIVAAYGLILPQAVLDCFPLGCINIHASLLPRWRGAAPIQRAILAGDTLTGISIMRMDAGLDTGPVLLSREIAIASDETAASLHDKLAALGARCIVECLPALEQGALRAVPQSEEGVTYASKIQKSEAAIDWTKPAEVVDGQVRALNPFPVASTTLHGEVVRIWASRLASGQGGPAGQVLCAGDEGIIVGCGNRAVCLLELQRASSKRLTAAQFLRGYPLPAGERFGT